MQAVILASDRGSSLYPLTLHTPKPMVGVFDKPILEHTIELLKHYDICDIVITLAQRADQVIDYFGGGSKWGVNIQYSLEDTPKGTAGGLRRIQPLLNGTFVVIPGDAITDFDLKAAVEFHRKQSAIATLLAYKSEEPSVFGALDSSNDGRIEHISEKPSKALTGLVNTGIYMLEPELLSYVPYDVRYDFSKDVFPLLLQNQEPLYSFAAEGYWSGLNDLAQYRNVHFDALTRKVKLNLPANRITDGIWIGADAEIHPSVKLHSPLYVGNGVRILKNSGLGRFAVVGDTSIVNQDAQVKHSILRTGAYVGKAAQVFGSVLGKGFCLADGKHLADETVVRDDSMNILSAQINHSHLSQLASDEHAFTWSGLEMTRLVNEMASMYQMAA